MPRTAVLVDSAQRFTQPSDLSEHQSHLDAEKEKVLAAAAVLVHAVQRLTQLSDLRWLAAIKETFAERTCKWRARNT